LSEDTRPVSAIDRDFWKERRVLLTGHTGFKGAWLSLWLQALGARVTGLAPLGPPTRPSLYELARVGEGMRERTADVRDAGALLEAVAEEAPEVVLHLAAQPLVRRSYLEPAHTYEVNVMGTVNVLEAVRRAGGEVRAVVVVTSDKCYENPSFARAPTRAGAGDEAMSQREGAAEEKASSQREEAAEQEALSQRGRPFVEGDPLGGEDPYSSSKACAELVAAAYRSSFFSAARGDDSSLPETRIQTQIATARAGNVIGGGDWGADRLIPDIVRAVQAGEAVRVRNPDAVRPWQHVLNPLSGYLVLARELHRAAQAASSTAQAGSNAVQVGGSAAQQSAKPPLEAAGAWNFGPAAEDARTVGWVVQRLAEHWGGALRWDTDGGVGGEANPPEADYLALASTKAQECLGWSPEWGLEEALERVVSWHEAHRRGEDMRTVSLAQIAELG
jgi:CDP-glucose 4,6-dehydratase